MENIYLVYKITNLVSGKFYIGKTINNIRKRFNSHKLAARKKDPKDFSYIHRALLKYGFDNFKIEELSRFSSDQEAKNEEIRLIALYNSTNREIGYNISKGGDGAVGVKHSEEAKKKMSLAKHGKYIGNLNPFFGKKHSEETKIFLKEKSGSLERINFLKKHNMNQCKLSTEDCIKIQEKYINKIRNVNQLSDDYNINQGCIYSIIKGTYFAIKGKSIISTEIFNKIKNEQIKINGLNHKKFTQEKEQEIINIYSNSQITLKDICFKYKTTPPTIRKILRKNNIKIRSRKEQAQLKN